MSKHSKPRSRTPGMAARQYVSAGVTAAAMVGTGVLLATAPGAPAPTTAEVKLASTEIPLGPLDCLFDPASCGGLIGSAGSPTPTVLAAASPTAFAIFGPGGFLFGDGLDALEIDPTCTSLCRGGNGGLLGGSGGDGAFGGDGGNAGFFFGNGGNGGAGIDAVYGTDPASSQDPRPHHPD